MATHPNIFKCCNLDCLPLHISSGDLPFNSFDGDLFIKYTAMDVASAQYFLSIPASSNIVRAHSIIVLLALSASPFCCGL